MRRLMVVCMALAIICIAVPLGHTQTVPAIGQCPPDSRERVCADINGKGQDKAAWKMPESPTTGTALAIGQCPPDSRDRVCADINGKGQDKAWTLR